MIKLSLTSPTIRSWQPPELDSRYSRMLQQVKKPIGITSKEWNSVSKCVRQKGLFWESVEESFKIKKGNSHLKVSILVASDDLLVFVNKQSRYVGSGGQRKVKKAFSLCRNKYVAYKPLSETEIRYFPKICKMDALAVPFAVYTYCKMNGERKSYGFETLYHSNLLTAVGCKLNLAEMFLIFERCLEGLRQLHAKTTRNGMHYFHKDVKLENILYMAQGGSFWEDGLIDTVGISDFGYMNDTESPSGTLEYYSPEHARIRMERDEGQRSAKKLKKFYFKNGRALDIWALGICFVRLLRNPLSCLDVVKKQKLLVRLSNLKQEDIDKDLQKGCKRFNRRPARSELWKLCEKMLRVAPQERISAKEALLEFQMIKEKYGF